MLVLVSVLCWCWVSLFCWLVGIGGWVVAVNACVGEDHSCGLRAGGSIVCRAGLVLKTHQEPPPVDPG